MRHKLSKEKIEEILSKPFKVWPEPKLGQPYGAATKQKLIFLQEMPDEVKPHLHNKDIILYIGGSQGSKTTTGIALALTRALQYPGILIIYGAAVYKDLQDIVIPRIEKLFSVESSWDHPYVHRKPNEHSKTLFFTNGSSIQFLPFEDTLRLRGRTADLIIMEEATQLQDAKAFEEAGRRLSSNKIPILQLVLLTNNPEQFNWLYDKFALKQFMPAYVASGGPKIPIGTPCSCHLCQKCLFPTEQEKLGGKTPQKIAFNKKHVCPNCKSKQESYQIGDKVYFCPGNQEFWRVIKVSSQDNPHLASTYIQDNMGAMDEETAASYITGEFRELRKGKVYWAFTNENVLPANESIDWNRDLIWSFDFNTSIQCSNVWQEYGSEGEEIVYCVDEVILPGNRPNGPEYIVEEFLHKIMGQCPDFETLEAFKKERQLLIYGDPNGWSHNKGTSDASYYEVIYSMLRAKGFKVKMMIRKIKGGTVIPIKSKVNSANLMYRTKTGEMRVFINPRCNYLITALDGVRFKPDGKTIDDTVDKRFAAGTDFSLVWPLTHPTDAAAYYLARRFPVVLDNLINPFAIDPADNEMIQMGARLTREAKPEKPKSLKPSGITLMKILEDYGIHEEEDDESNIFNFYI